MADPKTRLRRARLIHTMREAEWRDRAADFADAQRASAQWQGIAERVGKMAQEYGESRSADTAHMLQAERTMVANLNVIGLDASASLSKMQAELARTGEALGSATERRRASGDAAKEAERAARKPEANGEVPRSRKTGTAFE